MSISDKENKTQKIRTESTSSNDRGIRGHIEMLHSLADSTDGKLIVASYGQDPDTGENIHPKVHHFQIGDVERMVAIIEQLTKDKHRNIYIPLAVMRSDLPQGKKGSEADVVAVLGLVCDFDDDDAAAFDERLPVDANYVLKTSPGRFQAFLFFDEPLSLSEAKPLAERLQKATDCDYGTADISHVWRVPGTLNWPNAKKVDEGRPTRPVDVRVVESWTGTVTDFDELDDALPELSAQEKKSKAEKQHKDRRAGKSPAGIGRIPRQPIPENLTARINASPEPGEDRSARAFGIIKSLQGLGYTADDVCEIVETAPEGIGERYVGQSDKLLDDVERIFDKEIEAPLLDPKAPLETARLFINESHATLDGLRTLHHLHGGFYEYTNAHYSAVSDDTVRAGLYYFLEKATIKQKKGSTK